MTGRSTYGVGGVSGGGERNDFFDRLSGEPLPCYAIKFYFYQS